MLIEQEIGARRERAQGAVTRILARPAGGVYGDYQIRSSSNSTYRVAMRGPLIVRQLLLVSGFRHQHARDLQAHRSSAAQAPPTAQQGIRR